MGDSPLAAMQIEVGSGLLGLAPAAGIGSARARFKSAAALSRALVTTGIPVKGVLVEEIVQGHGLRLRIGPDAASGCS